jgi:hypothetical protein
MAANRIAAGGALASRLGTCYMSFALIEDNRSSTGVL